MRQSVERKYDIKACNTHFDRSVGPLSFLLLFPFLLPVQVRERERAKVGLVTWVFTSLKRAMRIERRRAKNKNSFGGVRNFPGKIYKVQERQIERGERGHKGSSFD